MALRSQLHLAGECPLYNLRLRLRNNRMALGAPDISYYPEAITKPNRNPACGQPAPDIVTVFPGLVR